MTQGCGASRALRAGGAGLVVLALAAGLALRLDRLDARPMHHDEANQAVKFGALLETGAYRYDVRDHHGPTLYYLALPAAWARGQRTFASLDERTLRGVPVVFGAAMILLVALLSDGLGRAATVTNAWLLALSPAMVFYSRMFIQEMLLTCFTLAFIIATGRVATGGSLWWSALAGIAGGLVVATKETSVIVLPAALAACAVARWSIRSARSSGSPANGRWRMALGLGLVCGTIIAALFFSSFFAVPEGVLGPFRSARTYLSRGISPTMHVHPWHYYIGLLAYSSSGGLRWSEGAVLALAAVAAVFAWRNPGKQGPERAFWARYFTCYVAVVMTTFSAIPYKTPWNVLPFYVGLVVLAGTGFSNLVRATTSRAGRAALAAAMVAGSCHLGWQAWRAAVTYSADSRNPYVYAQTLPDAVRMARRIQALASLHPQGSRMQVSVIAPAYEQWPLPWYLRSMPHVGYWSAPDDSLALRAPVIVCSLDHADALERTLGEGYISEFYGLRPEVLLQLSVERGLWDRYVAASHP